MSKSLLHLEHLEDLVFTQGHNGVEKTINFLHEMDNIVCGVKSQCEITTKWDGSPSIVCGEKDGQFFVGTKSVFNKIPKINYTNEDIDSNYPKDAHLNITLKIALKYLPELNMKGIYQGDVMYTWHDTYLQHIEGVQYLTFQPNTITYGVPVGLQLAKRIMESRIGVIFHTKYDENLILESHAPNIGGFNMSDNVWYRDASLISSGNLLNENDSMVFHEMLDTCEASYNSCPKSIQDKFVASKTISDLAKLFVNDCVRKDIVPNAKLLTSFVTEIENGRILQAKKEETKVNRAKEKDELLRFFHGKEDKIQHLFDAYVNINAIKQLFIASMGKINSSIEPFLEDVNGSLKPTSPEGFVLINKSTNDIVKIVNRAEFSKANFDNKDWQ